ncbi:MAG TPA: hypothetical protein VIH06_06520, partial [Ilumatobacteraceae bacterium]
RPSKVETEVANVIGQIASESTLRGGRLLAPFAIRYIVVPVADGAVSTIEDPLPLPEGLVDALDDQLDFAAPLTRPLNFVVYENTAWIPTRAQFSAADADATRQAGLDSLARLELRPMVTPIAIGAGDNADANFPAQPGVVTFATGVDAGWTLRVDDQTIAPRPAFGVTTGYDVANGGAATLHYDTAFSRALALIGELLVWLLLLLGVSRFDTSSIVRWKRRRGEAVPDAPLLSIDAPIGVPFTPPDAALLTSLDDRETPWQSQPETDPDSNHPDTESDNEPDRAEHQAGVE